MTVTEFVLTAEDGHRIALRRWIPVGRVQALVQISHGMIEHSARYDRFARALVERGFAVQAHDHRGHGKSASDTDALGILAEEEGFLRVVQDLKICIDKFIADLPGLPLFLFGHSFGSFISQSYIENYGSGLSGCVLSGSAGPRPALVGLGRLTSELFRLVCGKKRRSALLNKLIFFSYNKKIKPKRTESDWLSRDESEVDAYVSDPFCTFVPSVSFFCDLMKGLKTIHRADNMSRIPHGLPVLLCAGTGDPVGNYGKSVQQLYDIYQKNGMADVEMKLYPGARHELLNEINKDEVTTDILNWLISRCPAVPHP